MPRVWPRWPRKSVITSDFPVCTWAILTALSLASEPLADFRCTRVRFGGETSASFDTSAFSGSVWNLEVTWISRPACSRTVSTISGWAYPRLRLNVPEEQSK